MIKDLEALLADSRRSATFTRLVVGGYLAPTFGSRSETDLLIFTALGEGERDQPLWTDL